MKYIEIAEGLSVRMDKIEAISRGDDNLTSKVHTQQNIYNSTFPYSVLLELLEREGEIREDRREELNILKEIETPAW